MKRRFSTQASPIFGLWRPLQEIAEERARRRRNALTAFLLTINLIVWWLANAVAFNLYPFAR